MWHKHSCLCGSRDKPNCRPAHSSRVPHRQECLCHKNPPDQDLTKLPCGTNTLVCADLATSPIADLLTLRECRTDRSVCATRTRLIKISLSFHVAQTLLFVRISRQAQLQTCSLFASAAQTGVSVPQEPA